MNSFKELKAEIKAYQEYSEYEDFEVLQLIEKCEEIHNKIVDGIFKEYHKKLEDYMERKGLIKIEDVKDAIDKIIQGEKTSIDILREELKQELFGDVK